MRSEYKKLQIISDAGDEFLTVRENDIVKIKIDNLKQKERGSLGGLGVYLPTGYNWDIVEDEGGANCLICHAK